MSTKRIVRRHIKNKTLNVSTLALIIVTLFTIITATAAFAGAAYKETSNNNTTQSVDQPDLSDLKELRTSIRSATLSTIVNNEVLHPITKVSNSEEEILKPLDTEQAKDTEESQQLIHIVEAGDNFWNLSIKYYGDGYYCFGIKKYNNITGALRVGQELIIPDKNNEEFLKLCEEEQENGEYSGENRNTDSNNIGDNTVSDYTYGRRVTPAVNIEIPSGSDMKNYTDTVDTSNYELLGSYKITGYTPGCAHCCGGSTAGIGASGVKIIPGYSVAMKGIDFGTTIYIEGYGYYVVEDRGVGAGVVDIACPDHDACGPVTARGINVYIVK